jgi:muramoyltetrapeptide carboxypeptidase LdcA involved in peptidoglycan recycling
MLAPKLNKGDMIAVFSPSSPATKTAYIRYQRARIYLENKGLKFFEGILSGKQDFYRSGSIRERAEELNELIKNPEIKCIMSSIGGMNSNSLLPYIDYETLRKNPKIIIGFSDVTAILLAVYAKTGITTYYGPAVVASFGEFPPFVDETFHYFSDIVMKNVNVPHTYKNPDYWTDEFVNWETQSTSKKTYDNELVTVNGGKSKGRLIGGNLNTMQGIWNTEYMPVIQEGDILFIEDSLKDAATIERSFSLLKISGVFDKVSGVILGKHEQFKDLGTGRKPYEILEEVMGNVNYPILAEFDSCHTHPMITLPIGCEVELDATNKTVTLLSDFIGY